MFGRAYNSVKHRAVSSLWQAEINDDWQATLLYLVSCAESLASC